MNLEHSSKQQGLYRICGATFSAFLTHPRPTLSIRRLVFFRYSIFPTPPFGFLQPHPNPTGWAFNPTQDRNEPETLALPLYLPLRRGSMIFNLKGQH